MYSIKKAEKKIRKNRLLAVVANISIFSAGAAVLFYFYRSAGYDYTNPVFHFKSLLAFVITASALYGITSLYRKSTINLVMPYVVTKFEDRFGKDFAYSQTYDISKSMLDKSGLVNTADRIKCSDMIKVQYPEGDKMLLCNVSTYRVTRNKDGKETEHLVDSGIFVRRLTDMETNTHFVIRDKQFFADNSINIRGEELNLIRKVQPAFDKHYHLYTSDAIKAFRFLSPSVIEKFMEMATVKGHVSELSLFNHQVFLFINGAEIEVSVQSMFVTPKIDKMIKESYDNITAVLDMVDFVYNEQRITRLSQRK